MSKRTKLRKEKTTMLNKLRRRHSFQIKFGNSKVICKQKLITKTNVKPNMNEANRYL